MNNNDKNKAILKKAVWAYILLLIFEGALRKWILPGLATPLLIVRDPIAIYIIVVVWQTDNFPKTVFLPLMFAIGVISVFTAMLFGHGNLTVAIYGARILLIHFPVMFAIGRIFDRHDVLQVGKVFLYISIPMVVLIAMQFYTPQSSFVNRGIGGDLVGSGFSGALGYYRPAGTFSFANGTTSFFSVAACFVIYFWMTDNNINRLLLIGSSLAVLASIPLSISRSLLFGIILSVIFAIAATLKSRRHIGKVVWSSIIIFFALLILSQLSFFQTATEAFTSRFDTANESEGGLKGVLGDRFLGGLIGALLSSSEQPFFGFGLGMGTNAGAQLLTGKTDFLISEGEWGRLIGEMGAILGLTVIYIRMALSYKLAIHAYKKLSVGDVLPWLLLSFGLLLLPQGQWAQPTSLGFSVLVVGLIIASFRSGNSQQSSIL